VWDWGTLTNEIGEKKTPRALEKKNLKLEKGGGGNYISEKGVTGGKVLNGMLEGSKSWDNHGKGYGVLKGVRF